MRMLEKIEQYIDSCIEAGDIYGASFSLITPKGINQYYHGKQGRDEFAVGLDPAMIYDLASVTKVVGTTTRIFQLLSDHTIHLTDSVARFLPGFTHPEITIKNLLLHKRFMMRHSSRRQGQRMSIQTWDLFYWDGLFVRLTAHWLGVFKTTFAIH